MLFVLERWRPMFLFARRPNTPNNKPVRHVAAAGAAAVVYKSTDDVAERREREVDLDALLEAVAFIVFCVFL